MVGVVDRVAVLRAMAETRADSDGGSYRQGQGPGVRGTIRRAGAADRRRSAAILAGMIVAYFLLEGRLSVADSLIWQQLPSEIDKAQDWLLEQRTAEDPNIFFAILDGFRALADWLVTALLDFFEWLTWVGMIAASTLFVWRFGGWRAGLIVFGAFVSFALMGLWEESIQTLALMTAAVLLSLAIGVPIGDLRRPQRPLPPRHHAGPRRDADRARLRVPHADRDPVLGRARRRGDLHPDLRDPAGGPHHRAGHARRHGRIGGGVAGVRRDQVPDPLQGAAPAGAPPDAAGA